MDGIDGLEKAKEKQFDLVLTDKDMPRMTGLVLLDNLRRMEQYKQVPVIAVSADQSPEVVSEFQRLGVSSIIAKSDFRRGALVDAVNALVNV